MTPTERVAIREAIAKLEEALAADDAPEQAQPEQAQPDRPERLLVRFACGFVRCRCGRCT